jgi:hypothetical protein
MDFKKRVNFLNVLIKKKIERIERAEKNDISESTNDLR